MSLRIVPPSVPSQAPKHMASSTSEFGVHDTFREGFRSLRGETTLGHPLETHLDLWDETQEQLRYNIARSTFGLHAPLRLQMEKALIKQHIHAIPVLPSRNLALDVLTGKSETIDFEDFLGDVKMPYHTMDPHTAMERALGI
eukprot:jgi/Hompol1/571/HPOL_002554-RA